MADYYARLGIPRDATEDAVKAAFRALAKRHHPDLNPGNAASEAAFKSVNEAYAVLSDATARLDYDRQHHYSAGPSSSGFSASSSARYGAASSRARQQQAAAQAPPQYARGTRSGNFEKGWEDPSEHIDYDEWKQAHYGPSAGAFAWNAERVREAAANGFANFNDARATPHQNWQARRAAKEAAAAWAAAHSGADGVDGETRSYRAWAHGFKAQSAAAERTWPRTVAALAALGALAYFGIFNVMRSPQNRNLKHG
jgi:curved DNA-binding protein CbpA